MIPLTAAPRDRIRPEHRDRLAVVYIRQSTPQQVERHQESGRLQYALVDHAIALGWPRERILVIDEDQGHSAASAQGRLGFQRLVAEVCVFRRKRPGVSVQTAHRFGDFAHPPHGAGGRAAS